MHQFYEWLEQASKFQYFILGIVNDVTLCVIVRAIASEIRRKPDEPDSL